MRIRWTIGTYYGPTHAPTALVLFAFPLALVALLLSFRWLASSVADRDDGTEATTIVRLCALATLSGTVLTQIVLIGLNVA